jgi:hypothetical protein
MYSSGWSSRSPFKLCLFIISLELAGNARISRSALVLVLMLALVQAAAIFILFRTQLQDMRAKRNQVWK